VAIFKVLSRHSPGDTEENHENLIQDSRNSGPRYEYEKTRKRSKTENPSTTNFGYSCTEFSFRLDGPQLIFLILQSFKYTMKHVM
jgi:hypothetical protein